MISFFIFALLIVTKDRIYSIVEKPTFFVLLTIGLDLLLVVNSAVLDLICHGSPSPQLLEKFLEENKVNIHTIENLKFRNKTAFGLESGYKRISFDAQQDLYTFAFLTSLDYTENCYSCRYATLDRVSDITLGDSWGSELSREEQKKGISLILCQTEKGVELVKSAGFELEEVLLTTKRCVKF